MVQEVSKTNLKPFTGANDPRRQNGRKVGAINRKTAIRKLLSRDIDPNLIITPEAKDRIANLKDTTYLEAIILTLVNQSLSGNTKASDLLLRELRYVDRDNPQEDPFNRNIEIRIVNPIGYDEKQANANRGATEGDFSHNGNEIVSI